MRPPSPADIAARELREGNVVSLGPSPSRCTVAFSKGGERSVLLSVENMPDMPAPTPKAASDSHTASDTPASTDALPMVAAACPAAALLDPKRPEDATKGTVLSVAPLLGACPELDPSHSNWVHVDIRTQLSTLLGIVTRAPPGLDLAALEKGIVSGHWVVAFASKEAAEVGAEAVQGARMTYAEQLELLLVPLVGRSEDGMGCAAAT